MAVGDRKATSGTHWVCLEVVPSFNIKLLIYAIFDFTGTSSEGIVAHDGLASCQLILDKAGRVLGKTLLLVMLFLLLLPDSHFTLDIQKLFSQLTAAQWVLFSRLHM